ncbi:MAG: DUF445 domain-containing protein [bacterium]|nr:DUF445 domain-containing protein [bacterium]
MSKSLATNLVAIALIAAGFYTPYYADQIKSMGFFAFSGAITNWLAIYMLFEKIPLLYGSGVIPSRFTEFKSGIKELVMGQFFSEENIASFFESHGSSSGPDLKKLAASFDKDVLFGKFISVVEESQFGSMLGMFGGVEALEPLREPFIAKFDETFVEIAESKDFQAALAGEMSGGVGDSIRTQVEVIVDGRLAELTPEQVKEIIQDMIRKHLGWLVVWGGVFGALIGLAMSFAG